MSDENVTEKSERDLILAELLKQHPIFDIVSFNEFSLDDKLKEHAFMLVRYRELLAKEKDAYDQIVEILERVQGEVYNHYRFEVEEDLRQKEIELYYIPRDPKIIKIKKALAKQKVRVNFFETCAKAIEKMGWNMRNYLESQKVM